ncbi:MAG: Zn-dependent oligopeptidase [bacterium]|nr:Zn-dependent oligopeptidase [bacterium]
MSRHENTHTQLLLISIAVAALAACSSTGAGARSAGTDLDARFEVKDDSGADSPIAEPIAAANAAIDAIVAIPDGERTYANTLFALDGVVATFFNDARMTGFLSQVSTDSDERDRGRAASADLSDWFTLLNKREDLFEAVTTFSSTGPDLDPVEQRYLDVTLRDFRREGMELSAEDRARLLEVDRELNVLGIEFSKNIADDETIVVLSPDDLRGTPQAFLDGLPQSGGLYLLPVKGAALGRVLGFCENGETRKKVAIAASRRAGTKNVDILEKMILLRSEKAQLLGYAHIADFQTETRMAGSADAVWAFYDELRPKLRLKAEQDFSEYQAAKRQHTQDPNAQLQTWDLSFYKNWLLRERYAVDSEKVREYFPIEAVTEGLFGVTQDLYGLRYVDITDRARSDGRPMWHEDVKLYEVWDRDSGTLFGEFYTDLHPRPNKYSHAAQFPLRLRKRWADGTLTRPLVALVCNFTKPTNDRPALLSHDEVETYFHEFGHCLHSILSESDLSNFAGTQVARDFVEAPSQMFENWIWDADVLGRFSRHYQTGEQLPADVLRGMIAAKNLGSGLSAESQVFLGVMDMRFHTDADGVVDTTAVRREVYADTRTFEALPNLFSQASFGHMVGYHAGYYGYLWSLVYAQDMFSRFREGGDIMSPALGKEYRDKVLSRGGTRDEIDLVRDFLGREPNSDAFLEHLGLRGE